MSLARSPPPPARPKRALSRAGVRDAHVPGGQVAQLRRRGELHRAPLQGARRVPLPRRAAARLVRAARVQQDPLRRGDGGGSRSPEIRVLEIPDGWAPHPPPAGERERESRERRGTPPETDGPLYTLALRRSSARSSTATSTTATGRTRRTPPWLMVLTPTLALTLSPTLAISLALTPVPTLRRRTRTLTGSRGRSRSVWAHKWHMPDTTPLRPARGP